MSARYLSSAGMPDVFAGFFDRELGVSCSFALTADGLLRCLPDQTASAVNVGWVDADCRRAVHELSPACEGKAAYGYLDGRLSCGARSVGSFEPFLASAPRHSRQGDECLSDGTIDLRENLYVLSEDLAPEMFVQGSLQDLPGGCGGSLRMVQAEDGAFGPFTVIDAKRGIACDQPSSEQSAPDACRPTRRAFEDSTLRLDAACTERAERYATWLDEPSCPLPDLIRPSQEPDIYYEVASVHEGALYAVAPSCEPAREKPWIGTIFDIGAPVARSTLAQFHVVKQGSGRIRAYVTHEGETPLKAFEPQLDWSFWDEELGAPCVAMRFADDVYRCLPAMAIGGGWTHLYADADCTTPLRPCTLGEQCDGAYDYDWEPAADACDAVPVVTAAYRLTEAVTEQYYRSGIDCLPSPDVHSNMWRAEAVDPTTLGAFAVGERTD